MELLIINYEIFWTGIQDHLYSEFGRERDLAASKKGGKEEKEIPECSIFMECNF